MTGPSENAFMLTVGASTAATLLGLYLANRAMLRQRPDAPLRASLGPSTTPRSLGLTLLTLLAGCGVVGGVGVALHHVVGDAMLWWIAVALVPLSLGPSLVVGMWAVAADARGEVRIDGDTVTVSWDGEDSSWYLPDCTAIVRLTPSDVPGSDAALLLMIDGPTGVLSLVLPLLGITGARVIHQLQLPDGWFRPQGAVFPVPSGAVVQRPLVDAILARVRAVDRG
jgi:hypothetical protein